DGVSLHGWFFPNHAGPPAATVIFFHGNGGNITNVGWVGERLALRGMDVLVFDYRGYGLSDGEAEDEEALYADADAAYEFLMTQQVQPESVVLYGQSLGTVAAVDLASRRRSGALILESGVSSASDMASSVLPWLPRQLHFLGRNRFESARKLRQVKCPVLITHGDPDTTIPTDHARALFAAANERRKLMIFPGAGHNVFGSIGDPYLDIVSQFVKEAMKQKG
ncbi:MAG: alpha/beta hydrolase, partial [Pyrinomonadaceae bacterium]